MIVANVMSRGVIAVSPETPVAQAIALMTDHNVSGLPVVTTSGELVGIFTEGDLLRRVEVGTDGDRPGWLAGFLRPGHEAEKFVQTHGRLVGEVMTDQVIAVAENTGLDEAVRLMQHHHIRRLPVVRDGRLVGILSRRDVMRQVGAVLSQPPETVDDARITRVLLAAMKGETWAGPGRARVTVRNGEVQLDGCLFDLRERDALTVLAETVPGVTRVDNRTVCIDPNLGTVLYDPAAEAVGRAS